MGTQSTPVVAYRVIAADLRAALLRGEFAGGAQLPIESALADHYRVSRQTIRRAFQELVAEGLVERTRGRGTFAANPSRRYLRQFGSIADLMGFAEDTKLEVIEPLRRCVNVEAAGRLRLDGDIVHRLVFTRSFDDAPFSLTTVYLPPDIAERLDDVEEVTRAGAQSNVTIIGVLEAHLGITISEADQSITAESATEALASSLGCSRGAPLLRIDRVYLGLDNAPVELAVAHFLPDHYSYRVKLRRGT